MVVVAAERLGLDFGSLPETVRVTDWLKLLPFSSV
jgi:hypothetical protein